LVPNITSAATDSEPKDISDEAFAVMLLFLDQVKEDCTENHKFERNRFLEATHKAKAEAIQVGR
jgi:hypothetical protein